jgi:hypothetical protein
MEPLQPDTLLWPLNGIADESTPLKWRAGRGPNRVQRWTTRDWTQIQDMPRCRVMGGKELANPRRDTPAGQACRADRSRRDPGRNALSAAR